MYSIISYTRSPSLAV